MATELGKYLTQYLDEHPDIQALPLRALAKKAGIGHETLRQTIQGIRVPGDEVVTALAAALPGSDLEQMLELAARDRLGPFVLPPEFDLLDQDERNAMIVAGLQYLRSSGKLSKAAKVAAQEDPSATTVKRGRQQPTTRLRRAVYGRPERDGK